MQDRRPPGPSLPPLDRSVPLTQPAAHLGPPKLDSAEAKLAVQKSMINAVIPIKITTLLPCAVAACLNLTNVAQVSYDLSFGQYRFSPICPECQKTPRP